MSWADAGMCDCQVSEYLGDLRLRSVSTAMTRVGSRQNLSSTAAAFMDLAEEEEDDDDTGRGSEPVRVSSALQGGTGR